jgi:hypothetical protein
VDSSVLSLVSLVIALIAVAVAMWQARASAIRAERAISLPVLAEISHEIRSSEFHDCLINLLTQAPSMTPKPGGFEALPKKFRKNAYRICYFFDYLGILTKYGIVTEDIAVDWIGTRLMQVWAIMRPFIEAERDYRRALPPEAPKGFLLHYEHLADVVKKRQITQTSEIADTSSITQSGV